MPDEFEEGFTDDDLRDLHRMVQQAALRSYPNPERIGCPGSRVLEEVASAKAPFQHPAYAHIKTCSPCLAEMLDLRNAKAMAQTERAARRKFANRRTLGITLVTALAIVGIAIIPLAHYRGYHETIAVWNIPAVSREAKTNSAQNALTVGRRQGLIRMNLPLGSDEGQYEIEIRRSDEGPAVQSYTGRAAIINGQTRLLVETDFRNLSPGSYRMAYRHDHAAWHTIPLIVS